MNANGARAGEIARNLASLRERIAAAARRAGRDPAWVTLLAVGKTRPLEDILAAYAAGLRYFGENRVQEAEAKLPSLPSDAVLHLVGPLQSNKASRAARLFHVVETVDSVDLARRLDRAAAAAGRRLDVFLEVRLGGEATKAGAEPGQISLLSEEVRKLPALKLRGLMSIPPPGRTRPYFAELRGLAAELGLHELSMGMSDDFEEAIEEGSTLVRIGTALFGARESA